MACQRRLSLVSRSCRLGGWRRICQDALVCSFFAQELSLRCHTSQCTGLSRSSRQRRKALTGLMSIYSCAVYTWYYLCKLCFHRKVSHVSHPQVSHTYLLTLWDLRLQEPVLAFEHFYLRNSRNSWTSLQTSDILVQQVLLHPPGLNRKDALEFALPKISMSVCILLQNGFPPARAHSYLDNIDAPHTHSTHKKQCRLSVVMFQKWLFYLGQLWL